jgi:predicted transcriptional regulator
MSPLNERTTGEILYYLRHAGPAYAKKLAEILRQPVAQVQAHLKRMVKAGLIERVPGTMISYDAPGRGKVTKHMNHTYYRPTRQGKRNAPKKGELPMFP